MSAGFGVTPWVRTVAKGDLGTVVATLHKGRAWFRLAPDAPVVSGYEAGRDGFWIHRALTQLGGANRVVDSARQGVQGWPFGIVKQARGWMGTCRRPTLPLPTQR